MAPFLLHNSARCLPIEYQSREHWNFGEYSLHIVITHIAYPQNVGGSVVAAAGASLDIALPSGVDPRGCARTLAGLLKADSVLHR